MFTTSSSASCQLKQGWLAALKDADSFIASGISEEQAKGGLDSKSPPHWARALTTRWHWRWAYGRFVWPRWFPASRVGIWFVVGFSCLATILNLITSSAWERRMWAPAAALMLACSWRWRYCHKTGHWEGEENLRTWWFHFDHKVVEATYAGKLGPHR